MIKTKDKMEKMMLSAEEEEEEEEEVEEEEEEEEDSEEEKDGDDEGEDGGDEIKEAEVKTGATEGKIQPAAKKKNKAQSDVLNLNNEVVKMRKEVKRVRALIIRKLTRQIAALKKKKGKEMDLERNQRRAARLLEEVHTMKDLSPDLVTKTALQKNLSFEKVCKNPKSTISDRAIARIATHPQFSKKIESIKAAVKAFKDERMKGGKLVEKENEQKQAGQTTQRSPNKQEEEKSESKEEQCEVKPQKVTDDEVEISKDSEDAAAAETEGESCLKVPAVVQLPEIQESVSVKAAVVETCDVKDSERDEPQSDATEKQPSLKAAAPAVVQEPTDDQESDLESSDDEEREYFDDSTEERFRKQSSQSEESDDDDFFLGKVSKFKKKKKKDEGEETIEEGKKDSTDGRKPSDKLQKELDELESRLKSKASPFQSVFCSSLAGAKAGRGGATGRGRGDRFRGRGRPQGGSGPGRDFSQQDKFQKQQKGPDGNPVSKYGKPDARRPELSARGSAFAGRGRGRGRGDARGRGAFSRPAPQEALHPSWEASKKRKEQQGQILAFQGKKIKFDDDD